MGGFQIRNHTFYRGLRQSVREHLLKLARRTSLAPAWSNLTAIKASSRVRISSIRQTSPTPSRPRPALSSYLGRLASSSVCKTTPNSAQPAGVWSDRLRHFHAGCSGRRIRPCSHARATTGRRRRRFTDLKTSSAFIQDQFEITRYFELIGGIRFDRFDVDFEDRLNGFRTSRVDDVWSPRAGAVIKPWEPFHIYTSYAKSFLPANGDISVRSASQPPSLSRKPSRTTRWASSGRSGRNC